MKQIRIGLLLSAAAAWCDDGAKEWIRTNAIPLKTVEAGQGFDDLRPIGKIVGDARIVALGEATHGTREFFQLKHRMLEFLVREKGFTIFSIEASMPEAYRLNDYVLEGKGDPAVLLKGMYFWTWDTEEVLAMIRWMREYNRTAERKVQFTGFDMQTPTVALEIVGDYLRPRDAALAAHVTALTPDIKKAERSGPQSTFGVATVKLAGNMVAGKKVRLRGWIRTEEATGPAQLWMRADGAANKVLTFQNLRKAPPTGTTAWKEYSIETAIPANVESVFFGGTFSGGGMAWFDELVLETGGEAVPVPGVNLDFEAPALTGIYTGNIGYEVRLVTDIVQSGKQSLRMRRTAPPPAEGNGPAELAKEWGKVLKTMEGRPDAKEKTGAWAVQNARVVLQGLEMNVNMAMRDPSMARNVEWIAEQNPGAKMVLWAHNGHVQTGQAFRSMGQELRKSFGDKMVVFGFGFNRGSFQAIKPGAGLQVHKVGPAPEGSLDAWMAEAGPGLFALDLRNAPEALRKPLAMRSIGSMYAEEQASGYFGRYVAPAMFDALLFVENTTAARANPKERILSKAGDGVMRDVTSGVALRLPAGWAEASGGRWGDRETTLVLDGPAGAHVSLYYRVAEARTEQQVTASLAKYVAQKTAQRKLEGLADYAVREPKRHTVNGYPALSWTADFTERGAKMAEVVTYVESPTATGLFFARGAAGEAEGKRAQIDGLAEGVRLP